MMNYLKKQKANRDLKDLFKNTYPEGTCKWSKTTLTHWRVLCDVFFYLKEQGYEVWTECRLNDGSRADIVAIKGHIGWLIEILHTESDKRFQSKLDGSYGDFTVIPVYTKNFDYNTFKI